MRRAGVSLQRLELELPLIGATDLDDWPGGVRQQFKAAQPLIEALLKSVKQVPGLEGKVRSGCVGWVVLRAGRARASFALWLRWWLVLRLLPPS